jgi:hypothetical protein
MRDQLAIFQALAEGWSEVFSGWNGSGGTRMMGVRFDAEGVCDGVGYGREEGLVGKTGEIGCGFGRQMKSISVQGQQSTNALFLEYLVF